jgi:hypothetical protein
MSIWLFPMSYYNHFIHPYPNKTTSTINQNNPIAEFFLDKTEDAFCLIYDMCLL